MNILRSKKLLYGLSSVIGGVGAYQFYTYKYNQWLKDNKLDNLNSSVYNVKKINSNLEQLYARPKNY
jgi:hypothetical protein